MRQSVRLRDVAQALGLSETTVSRALSGKGRVSKETKKAVADYIRSSGYRPNMLAKGLAQSRAFSICAILPPDAIDSHQSFFHNCLMGVCACAEPRAYSVLITSLPKGEMARLERIIDGGSADGYILMRALDDDPIVELLLEREVPFVLIGSTDRENVVCVDTDNEEKCRLLTQKVLEDGFLRPGLLLGDMSFPVNRSRLRGFERATESFADIVCPLTRTGVDSAAELHKSLDLLLDLDCDAIFCGDDILSAHVLRRMRETGRGVPVVSLYGNELLGLTGGVYASVEADAHSLGISAAQKLLDMIDVK